MRKLTVIVFLATALVAQDGKKVDGHAWIDTFGTNGGAVLYPQYGWSAKTKIGGFSGYGFVEVAPHEKLFTNHLVIYTPSIRQFSVHSETGGIPRRSLGFFQIGPRINLHEVFPRLKKPLGYLFVTALPRFIGIRPNNLLVAAGTNKFRIAGTQWSAEGYRRFLPGGRPDYAEYWFLAHPKKTKPFSIGTFGMQSGDATYIGLGVRLNVF